MRHSVPLQVLSRVKLNLFQSCVVSIILHCSSSWSANISLTRKMESLKHKGLKWCSGNNSHSSLLQASETMPIAYQKIERDLRLFAGISSGATCRNFHDHFTVQCDNRSLRSNVKPKLASVPARFLLLFDLAKQDGNISGPKGPRGTRGNGDKSESRFILYIFFF